MWWELMRNEEKTLDKMESTEAPPPESAVAADALSESALAANDADEVKA